MFIRKLNPETKEIFVNIPLTTTSGKIRVKSRTIDSEYGLPFASRQNNFNLNNYVEWQIGYDSVVDDEQKLKLTTLPNTRFTAYNGKTKALYELSEYLYYFTKWQVFSQQDLLGIETFLTNLEEKDFIENHPNCKIKRTNKVETKINPINFHQFTIEYPLLIHKFGNYQINAEIVIKEKQRAVGTQVMLYFCFLITELKSENNLLGRTAETKEFADFVFDSKNAKIILEMIKIFGMLSKSHRADILAILKLINKENFSFD
jgi:hypothetical protein